MATRRRYTFYGSTALALGFALVMEACRSPQATPLSEPSGAVVASASPVRDRDREPPLASSAARAPAPVLEPPVALREPTPLVSLAVRDFGDAVVSVPLGALEPRPIALALHGNFDRPEWQCEVWRRITRGEVFVLCPRGTPRRDVPKELDRWEWGSLAKTKSELLAALAALRARYPEHVKPGPVIFTGFSLGAILGARLLEDPELDVGAAVLVEGGYQGWSSSRAARLKPGLKALLFACGQTQCRNAFRYELEPLMRRSGLPASMVSDVKAGHTYDEPLATLVQAEWPSLVASLQTQ